MFLICTRLNGNGQVSSWKRFTVLLEQNRLFRGTIRLSHVSFSGERENDDASLLPNVIEFRVANSEQVLRFMGSVVFESGRRVVLFQSEDVNLFLAYLYHQQDRIDFEYRAKYSIPEHVLSLFGNDLVYPQEMTADNTYMDYEGVPGTGMYEIKTSSTSTVRTRIYNKNLNDFWRSSDRYSLVDGSYTGNVSTDGYLGEYTQLKFPCNVNIKAFRHFMGSNLGFKTGALFALDDAENVIAKVWEGVIPAVENVWNEFELDIPGHYGCLRYVCSSTYNYPRMEIGEIEYVSEYDVHDPDEMQIMFHITK